VLKNFLNTSDIKAASHSFLPLIVAKIFFAALPPGVPDAAAPVVEK
jgi:hypothetical protein